MSVVVRGGAIRAVLHALWNSQNLVQTLVQEVSIDHAASKVRFASHWRVHVKIHHSSIVISFRYSQVGSMILWSDVSMYYNVNKWRQVNLSPALVGSASSSCQLCILRWCFRCLGDGRAVSELLVDSLKRQSLWMYWQLTRFEYGHGWTILLLVQKSGYLAGTYHQLCE